MIRFGNYILDDISFIAKEYFDERQRHLYLVFADNRQMIINDPGKIAEWYAWKEKQKEENKNA